MKLKINDFKKAGFELLNKYTCTKTTSNYYLEVVFNAGEISDIIAVFPKSKIYELNISIDDISTVEEIEELVENMNKIFIGNRSNNE